MAGDTMKDGPPKSLVAQAIPEEGDRRSDSRRVPQGLAEGVPSQGRS